MPVRAPAAGLLQDAINLLRGEYDARPDINTRNLRTEAAEEVAHMLRIYWSDEWPEIVRRRPDHVPEHLWEKWHLETELNALRLALEDAYARIADLRHQRDDARTREVKTDADIAAFVRSTAAESQRLEMNASEWRKKALDATAALRREREETERLRRQFAELES